MIFFKEINAHDNRPKNLPVLITSLIKSINLVYYLTNRVKIKKRVNK